MNRDRNKIEVGDIRDDQKKKEKEKKKKKNPKTIGASFLSMNLKRLRAAVNKFFAEMDTVWYAAGIKKLVSRYNKRLNRDGKNSKFCPLSTDIYFFFFHYFKYTF